MERQGSNDDCRVKQGGGSRHADIMCRCAECSVFILDSEIFDGMGNHERMMCYLNCFRCDNVIMIESGLDSAVTFACFLNAVLVSNV
jgi:hypothetical protein